MNSILIPDTGIELFDGSIVILASYPNTKWIVHYGKYTSEDSVSVGWYAQEIETKRVIVLTAKLLTDAKVVSVTSGKPTDAPDSPPSTPQDTIEFTEELRYQLLHTCLCVSTVEERDALVSELLPDGRIVKVNRTEDGPKYYVWNAAAQTWDTELFGIPVDTFLTRKIADTVYASKADIQSIQDGVAYAERMAHQSAQAAEAATNLVHSADQAVERAQTSADASAKFAEDAAAHAENAVQALSESKQQSQEAIQTAQTAVSKIDGMLSVATKIAQQGADAKSSAEAAQQSAAYAQSWANTANETAEAAQSVAQAAANLSLDAKQSAQAAAQESASAKNIAEQSIFTSTEARTAAVEAQGHAHTAQSEATKARQAAEDAQASADAVANAVTQASEVATSAESAARAARSAADNANSTAQSAEAAAERAANAAADTQAKAEESLEHANSVLVRVEQTAQDASIAAQSAQIQAEEAKSHAQVAVAQVEAAAQVCRDAQSAATQAINTGTAALQSADEAKTASQQSTAKAEQAKSAAQSAIAAADDAQSIAQSAKTIADAAKSVAEAANASASAAATNAAAAASIVQQAHEAVEQSARDVETAQQAATAASQAALDAANRAQECADKIESAEQHAAQAQQHASTAESHTQQAAQSAQQAATQVAAAAAQAKLAQQSAEQSAVDAQSASLYAEEAKSAAREAQGAVQAAVDGAVSYSEQIKSAEDKQQARRNIDAIGKDELTYFGDLFSSASEVHDISAAQNKSVQLYIFSIGDVCRGVVRGEGTIANYTETDRPYNVDNLVQLYICRGVTSIGDYFMCKAFKLKELTFENTDVVTHLGTKCFSYTQIDGEYSFRNLADAELNSPFMSCPNLRKVTLSSTVASIAERSFQMCTSLESVEGIASVTSIGDAAFQYCTSLETLDINPNIGSGITLGRWVFILCPTTIKVLSTGAILSDITWKYRKGVKDAAGNYIEPVYGDGTIKHPVCFVHKEWTAEQLQDIQNVIGSDVKFPVPESDNQSTEFYKQWKLLPIMSDSKLAGRIHPASGCCGLFSLFHIYNILHPHSQYDTFYDFIMRGIVPRKITITQSLYDALSATARGRVLIAQGPEKLGVSYQVGDQITAIDLPMALDSEVELWGVEGTTFWAICHVLGWTATELLFANEEQNGITGAEGKQVVLDSLAANKPTMLEIVGAGLFGTVSGHGMHAVAIIGYDSSTDKFLIVDSTNAFDADILPLVYWCPFESLITPHSASAIWTFEFDREFNDYTIQQQVDAMISVPSSTVSDNNKFLKVVNGRPAWVTVLNAEEVQF